MQPPGELPSADRTLRDTTDAWESCAGSSARGFMDLCIWTFGGEAPADWPKRWLCYIGKFGRSSRKATHRLFLSGIKTAFSCKDWLLVDTILDTELCFVARSVEV